MSRLSKDHDVRRNEILDTAQQFFYQKGYENTSVSDIIKAVGIAKGTFYHYFGSKQELLNELVQRVAAQMVQVMEPIVSDPALNAVEKLNTLFSNVGQWKVERKEALLYMLEALYRDENLHLRHRIERETVPAIIPIFTAVIQQGVEEGVFQTDYPADVGELLFRLNHALADTFADLMLAHLRNPDDAPNPLPILEHKAAVHRDAVARLLGTSKESLRLFDIETIRQWFE